MIHEHLLSRLATGFFAPQGLDRARAGYLMDGRLKLGDQVVQVDDPGTYDGAVDLPRNQVLLLHSMRWLDILRRTRDDVPGAAEAWSRIFEVWSRSAAAANPESAAWGALPLEQRSVAIALGAPDGSPALTTIPRHLEMLEKVEQEAAPAARRLKVLRVRLGSRPAAEKPRRSSARRPCARHRRCSARTATPSPRTSRHRRHRCGMGAGASRARRSR